MFRILMFKEFFDPFLYVYMLLTISIGMVPIDVLINPSYYSKVESKDYFFIFLNGVVYNILYKPENRITSWGTTLGHQNFPGSENETTENFTRHY